jgi:hypothetical protein
MANYAKERKWLLRFSANDIGEILTRIKSGTQ